MARFYSNENFPLQVVIALRALGHNVLTANEAGNANASIPDERVLAFAIQQGRALVTINRWDFVRLRNLNQDHMGIIVCSQDIDVEGQAQRIHAAIERMGDLRGQLIRINRPQR
ncbi:MAG TPA: DUF5615 family PIN-like protein [Anaerolineae bacterium]|nr:DUF5615 family PIN-like protein [Anaerolineae bacterium]